MGRWTNAANPTLMPSVVSTLCESVLISPLKTRRSFKAVKDDVQRKSEHLKHTDTMVKPRGDKWAAPFQEVIVTLCSYNSGNMGRS